MNTLLHLLTGSKYKYLRRTALRLQAEHFSYRDLTDKETKLILSFRSNSLKFRL